MNQPKLQIKIKEMYNIGAFASVYLADCQNGERQEKVAIKILQEKWLQDEDQLRRFWDEAQLLQKLHHPNIVKARGIFDFFGYPAIIMNFIDGFDLKYLLEHPQFQFSPKVAFQIACTIAKSIDEVYYHSQNARGAQLAVIHRDIKPSNIMINRHGLVQILDFGASRFENSNRMGSTNLYEPGVQKYSPPDRRLGAKGTHKGDIFAIGLLLIEMLQNQALPTPPLQQAEYQQFLHYHIEKINFGMPNQQWAQSVKETLFRICAFVETERLNAKQAVHMLEPYAKRAQGQSIEQLSKHYFPTFTIKSKQGQWSGKETTVQPLHFLYSSSTESCVERPSSTQTNIENSTIETNSKEEIPKVQSKWSFILSHQEFWRNFAISSITVFIFLHLVRWGILEVLVKNDVQTQTSDLHVSIDIEKNNITFLELFNSEEQSVIKMPRSKKTVSKILPKDHYTISIKTLHSSEENRSLSFDLTEHSTLICSTADDSFHCILNGEKL